MTIARRQFLQLAGAGLLAVVSRAFATEDYPNRPVRWIIGFPPGGGADQVARLIAPSLSERLGQQVVIETDRVPGPSSPCKRCSTRHQTGTRCSTTAAPR